jgi:transposase
VLAGLEGEPVWAIEGSATFGRVFVRRLLREKHPVLESPAHLTPRQRRRSRRPDKSDRDDAIAIARSALAEDKPLPPPRRDDRTALLKILITERDGVEAQVTRVRNRIHAHLVALPAEVRGRIYDLTTKRGIRSARAFDTDTGGVDAARAASIRRLGRQLEQLWDHSRELHAEIRREIRAMGTSLVGLRGMNALGAAKLLAETGDARRFRRRSCFGRFSGTAPIEASSGKVVRHRLSREGNRQVNRVLHTMAVTQLRDDPRAQAFVQRQTSAGATPREGLRALKRHLSNVAFRTMIGDLEEGRVRLELT